MIDAFNFIFGTAWGVFTFLCWTMTLRGRWRAYLYRRDARARRELLFVIPLWMISLLWGIVLFFFVVRDMADVGSTIRGLLFGAGVGLYTFAGLVGAVAARRRDR